MLLVSSKNCSTLFRVEHITHSNIGKVYNAMFLVYSGSTKKVFYICWRRFSIIFNIFTATMLMKITILIIEYFYEKKKIIHRNSLKSREFLRYDWCKNNIENKKGEKNNTYLLSVIQIWLLFFFIALWWIPNNKF